jgi:hypothetical protein
MRSIIARWLAFALVGGLVLAGVGVAQPPDKLLGPPPDLARPSPVSVDDIVAHIMSFDKNKDGKVTKDELPERMQHLIELGDTNKDGALDKDEIRKLATRLADTPGGRGGDVRIGFGRGPGPGGFGARGGVAVGGQIRLGPDAVEGVVEDLKLSGKKKEQAMAVAKAHQENVRKLMEQARAEMLEKMNKVLSDEEFKDFKAALDRPRGETFINLGPREAFPGGGQQKLDPPEK